MLRQVLKIIKLLGLPRAARMKKHHERGLAYVRGYAACNCWWTLLNNGFLDELAQHGEIEPADFARQHNWQEDVLEAIIEYLDGIDLLERHGQKVRLGTEGKILMAEPRGLLELLWAYEPCLGNLDALLKGEKKYGRDLTRNITYVGIGSGRLCEQLPYPVMRRMVLEHNSQVVLDLGCGDMAFLKGLCRLDDNIRGHGIDNSEEMIHFCREQLGRDNYNERLTCQVADMFDLPKMSDNLPEVDCITACDTFHEYLGQQDRIIELLRELRRQFPQALMVIGEFCLQDPQWLRKHPNRQSRTPFVPSTEQPTDRHR